MKRLLQRFGNDQRGNVLMITGLVFLILVIAAGMGIDFGRQQLLRVRMQQSSDAAALAAGTAPANTDQKQVAARYFNLNFTPSYLDFDRPDPNTTIGQNVTVAPSGSLRTTFMAYNDVKQMNVSGKSVVGNDTVNTNQTYDVILVMDNSLSMNTTDIGSADTLDPDAGAPPRPYNQNYYPGLSPAVPVNGATRINALRYSAVDLAQQLLQPNLAHSRVGAITWSTESEEVQTQDLTEDFNTIRPFLGKMIAYEATNSTTGLNAASSMANNFRPDSVRAVVLLTDGFNTMSGPVVRRDTCLTQPGALCPFDGNGCDGGPNPGDYCPFTQTASLSVCNNFKDHGVLVYTIAFGGDVQNGQPHASDIQDFLSNCASGTAGANQGQYFFVAPDAATLDDAFKSIVTSIGKVHIKE